MANKFDSIDAKASTMTKQIAPKQNKQISH